MNAEKQPASAESELCRRFAELVDTVRILRSPSGCPWDRAQTLDSIKKNLVEECCEVLDAMDAHDTDALREELGDLLLQILLQAQICHEQGLFSLQDIITSLHAKLVRRHPHVFGDARAGTPEQALASWQSAKAREGIKRESLLGTTPRHLPALSEAQKVQRRAAEVGFDWPGAAGVLRKLREETAETEKALGSSDQTRREHELGDLLFTVVNLCRHAGVEAEAALRKATRRFRSRFLHIQARLEAEGRDISRCSLQELDRLWEEAKQQEASDRSSR